MAERGVKPSALAENAGVSKGYISGILKGIKPPPSFEVCKKFSEVLQVSPSWLLFGDDGRSPIVLNEDPTPYGAKPPPEPTMAEAFQKLGEALDMLKKLMENGPKKGDEP